MKEITVRLLLAAAVLMHDSCAGDSLRAKKFRRRGVCGKLK